MPPPGAAGRFPPARALAAAARGAELSLAQLPRTSSCARTAGPSCGGGGVASFRPRLPHLHAGPAARQLLGTGAPRRGSARLLAPVWAAAALLRRGAARRGAGGSSPAPGLSLTPLRTRLRAHVGLEQRCT